MESIIKVNQSSLLHCSLIILLATIPITASAQEVIDTSAPHAILIEPTIVVPVSKVVPDCHNYTGCDVMVVKKHYYKPKRHRCYRPCYDGGCYVRPMGYCW